MFTHKREGYLPHKHETVTEARLCEQNRSTVTTVKTPDYDGTPVIREARHQDPCVCGVYDKCWEFRVADVRVSGNWRDAFRAYND